MAKKDAEETTAPATVLRVRSYAERFCRAGFRFYQEPTDLLLSELTPDQIEAIESEPNLYSERV
jgi:hypothetical protein